MKLMILGSGGQLGKELSYGLQNNNELYAFNKDQLDITDFEKLATLIEKINPKIIINCAAYTSVENSEKFKKEAYKVNHEAVKFLAQECHKRDIFLIHFSTDYIFDGNLNRSYMENDIPNPLNVYGKTKLEGEKEIISITQKYIILRISWVSGKYGDNFIKNIINSLKKGKSIKVIKDVYGSPTSTKLVLKVIRFIINNKLFDNSLHCGTYNLTSTGITTWFEMAEITLNLIKKHNYIKGFQKLKIIPIQSNQLQCLAKRPINSKLDTSKLQKILNFLLPNWEEDYKESVLEILNLNINE